MSKESVTEKLYEIEVVEMYRRRFTVRAFSPELARQKFEETTVCDLTELGEEGGELTGRVVWSVDEVEITQLRAVVLANGAIAVFVDTTARTVPVSKNLTEQQLRHLARQVALLHVYQAACIVLAIALIFTLLAVIIRS